MCVVCVVQVALAKEEEAARVQMGEEHRVALAEAREAARRDATERATAAANSVSVSRHADLGSPFGALGAAGAPPSSGAADEAGEMAGGWP